MKKKFLKNVISSPNSLDRLSRNSLIKLINLVPSYFDKNLIELIDEKIQSLNEEILIEISNIKINDLNAEINNTKFSKIDDLTFFKVYTYDAYFDIFFTEQAVDKRLVLEKLKNYLNFIEFSTIHISSRTIRVPNVFEKNSNDLEGVFFFLEKQLFRVKNIEILKIRFFFKKNSAPVIIKKIKKKNNTSHTI